MISNINFKLTWKDSIKLGMGLYIGFLVVKGIFIIVGMILAYIFQSGTAVL